jgi:hypothetical protein
MVIRVSLVKMVRKAQRVLMAEMELMARMD